MVITNNGCCVNKGRKALTGKGAGRRKKGKGDKERVVAMMTPLFGRTSVVCIGRGRELFLFYFFFFLIKFFSPK